MAMSDAQSICTIYKLINKINGMHYIGQTWQTLEKRWHAGGGYRSCIYIERAIKKYGKDNFYYEVLSHAITQEEADKLEDMFIEMYDSVNPQKGYNIRGGGSRGKLSEQTKQKISLANTGKKATEEAKHKSSISHKGQHSSPNTEFKKGKRYSPETEFKTGLIPWIKGKKLSEVKPDYVVWNKGIKGSVKPNSGSFKKGQPSHNKKQFTEIQIQDIKDKRSSGATLKSIAVEYNVDRSVITRILSELGFHGNF